MFTSKPIRLSQYTNGKNGEYVYLMADGSFKYDPNAEEWNTNSVKVSLYKRIGDGAPQLLTNSGYFYTITFNGTPGGTYQPIATGEITVYYTQPKAGSEEEEVATMPIVVTLYDADKKTLIDIEVIGVTYDGKTGDDAIYRYLTLTNDSDTIAIKNDGTAISINDVITETSIFAYENTTSKKLITTGENANFIINSPTGWEDCYEIAEDGDGIKLTIIGVPSSLSDGQKAIFTFEWYEKVGIDTLKVSKDFTILIKKSDADYDLFIPKTTFNLSTDTISITPQVLKKADGSTSIIEYDSSMEIYSSKQISEGDSFITSTVETPGKGYFWLNTGGAKAKWKTATQIKEPFEISLYVGSSKWDIETIEFVKNGDDAVTALQISLSNDSDLIPANAAGEVSLGALAGTETDVSVYQNGVQIYPTITCTVKGFKGEVSSDIVASEDTYEYIDTDKDNNEAAVFKMNKWNGWDSVIATFTCTVDDVTATKDFVMTRMKAEPGKEPIDYFLELSQDSVNTTDGGSEITVTAKQQIGTKIDNLTSGYFIECSDSDNFDSDSGKYTVAQDTTGQITFKLYLGTALDKGNAVLWDTETLLLVKDGDAAISYELLLEPSVVAPSTSAQSITLLPREINGSAITDLTSSLDGETYQIVIGTNPIVDASGNATNIYNYPADSTSPVSFKLQKKIDDVWLDVAENSLSVAKVGADAIFYTLDISNDMEIVAKSGDTYYGAGTVTIDREEITYYAETELTFYKNGVEFEPYSFTYSPSDKMKVVGDGATRKAYITKKPTIEGDIYTFSCQPLSSSTTEFTKTFKVRAIESDVDYELITSISSFNRSYGQTEMSFTVKKRDASGTTILSNGDGEGLEIFQEGIEDPLNDWTSVSLTDTTTFTLKKDDIIWDVETISAVKDGSVTDLDVSNVYELVGQTSTGKWLVNDYFYWADSTGDVQWPVFMYSLFGARMDSNLVPILPWQTSDVVLTKLGSWGDLNRNKLSKFAACSGGYDNGYLTVSLTATEIEDQRKEAEDQLERSWPSLEGYLDWLVNYANVCSIHTYDNYNDRVVLYYSPSSYILENGAYKITIRPSQTIVLRQHTNELENLKNHLLSKNISETSGLVVQIEYGTYIEYFCEENFGEIRVLHEPEKTTLSYTISLYNNGLPVDAEILKTMKIVSEVDYELIPSIRSYNSNDVTSGAKQITFSVKKLSENGTEELTTQSQLFAEGLTISNVTVAENSEESISYTINQFSMSNFIFDLKIDEQLWDTETITYVLSGESPSLYSVTASVDRLHRIKQNEKNISEEEVIFSFYETLGNYKQRYSYVISSYRYCDVYCGSQEIQKGIKLTEQENNYYTVTIPISDDWGSYLSNGETILCKNLTFKFYGINDNIGIFDEITLEITDDAENTFVMYYYEASGGFSGGSMDIKPTKPEKDCDYNSNVYVDAQTSGHYWSKSHDDVAIWKVEKLCTFAAYNTMDWNGPIRIKAKDGQNADNVDFDAIWQILNEKKNANDGATLGIVPVGDGSAGSPKGIAIDALAISTGAIRVGNSSTPSENKFYADMNTGSEVYIAGWEVNKDFIKKGNTLIHGGNSITRKSLINQSTSPVRFSAGMGQNYVYPNDDSGVFPNDNGVLEQGILKDCQIPQDILPNNMRLIDVTIFIDENLCDISGEYSYEVVITSRDSYDLIFHNLPEEQENAYVWYEYEFTYTTVETPFTVLEDGSLYASNANISGIINANSGKIGSWSLSTNQLTNYGDATSDPSGNYLYLDPNGEGTDQLKYAARPNSFCMQTRWVTASGSTQYSIAIGTVNQNSWASADFKVKHTGEVECKNLIATGGKIGDWTIGEQEIDGRGIYHEDLESGFYQKANCIYHPNGSYVDLDGLSIYGDIWLTPTHVVFCGGLQANGNSSPTLFHATNWYEIAELGNRIDSIYLILRNLDNRLYKLDGQKWFPT